MNGEHSELLKRLANYSPDDPSSSYPFSQRLARDNGWSLTYAQRVIREYKRFAFLAVAAGHPVTPSDEVDQAWHLHILYTESYWRQLCGEVLRKPLHHHPTKGGEIERTKFHDWYGRTLATYRKFFGEDPSPDIWPDARRRFGEDIQFIRVNQRRHWIIRKPQWLLARRNGIRVLGRWMTWWSALALGLLTCAMGCELLVRSAPGHSDWHAHELEPLFAGVEGPEIVPVVVGLALIFGFLWRVVFCWRKCPECGQNHALEKTGQQEKAGFFESNRLEWQCSYCGHKFWKDESACFAGGDADEGGGCGGCGGCG